MRQTHTTWLIAIGACALLGTHGASAIAQEGYETEPDKPRPGVRVTASSTAGGEMSGQPQLLSDLLDAQVLLQNGDAVGDITDLVLGPRGNILYALATYNGRNYLIPYRGMSFDAVDQTVQVNLTPEQFQDVQFFAGRNLPDVNSSAVRRQIMSLFVAWPVPAVADRRTQEDTSPYETRADRVRQDAERDDNRASAPDRNARDSARNDDRLRDDRPPSVRTARSATEAARQPTDSLRFPKPDAKSNSVGGAIPGNLGGVVPRTSGRFNPNVPGSRQPNPNAPTTPGTPGGAPIAPPGATSPGTPGGAPIAPSAGVTNPGGAPIKPPAGVTNPGGAPIKPAGSPTPNPAPTNPGSTAPR